MQYAERVDTIGEFQAPLLELGSGVIVLVRGGRGIAACVVFAVPVRLCRIWFAYGTRQALLDSALGLQFAVFVDVGDIDAELAQCHADQSAAMAALGLGFGAEQGHSVAPVVSLFEAGNTGEVEIGGTQQFDVDRPVTLHARIIGFGAERVTHKHVSHPGSCERSLQRLGAEQSMLVGIRMRTHVDQKLDVVRLQKIDHLRHRTFAQTNRKRRTHVANLRGLIRAGTGP